MHWLEPWHELAGLDWADERKASHTGRIEAQPQRVVGPDHALRGKSARLLATRFDDMDDVLFSLDDGAVTEVNVTWGADNEPDPGWLRTRTLASLEEWVRERMVPQHEEWRLINGSLWARSAVRRDWGYGPRLHLTIFRYMRPVRSGRAQSGRPLASASRAACSQS